MKRALRYLRNGVLAVLGLITVAVGWAWIEATLKHRQEEKVILKTDVNEARCKGTAFPLLITILNGSSKTILEVSMGLSAREPGYSTDLVDYLSDTYTSDRIIPSNEGWSVCYKFPKLKDEDRWKTPDDVIDKTKLEWSIKRNWIRFEE
jgi:hypothetical protein